MLRTVGGDQEGAQESLGWLKGFGLSKGLLEGFWGGQKGLG